MNRLIFVSLLLLSLTGCAKVYDNGINIVEYDAAGQYNPFAEAQAGGCAVYHKGTLPSNSTIEYKGIKCTVTIKTK